MKKIIYLLLTIILFTGCSTINTLDADKRDGTTFEVNDKTYDEVWAAAVVTMSRSLTIVVSEKENGILKAEKGAGLTTWGEVVGVFITSLGDDSYSVEVQSLKRSKVQITGQDWTNTIITGMKVELNQ